MAKTQEQVLQALIAGADSKPQKEVSMPRFGVKFTIQAIDNKTLARIREQATFPTKQGERLNETMMNLLMIEKACVVPNWSDPSLLEAYGVHDACAAIEKALLPGELSKLSIEILALSGFGNEQEEVEEIKKS